MKKLLALILVISLCAVLCCCGSGKEEGKDPVPDEPASSALSFKTTDLDGNSVSLSDYSTAKLILINMWEPWCGPCVAEMPDLEKLYQKYSSEGLVILGVFGNDTDVNARETVQNLGVTYPILHNTSDFDRLYTGYVPTSGFFDAQGNMLDTELHIGSMSYEDWEALITGYLK